MRLEDTAYKLSAKEIQCREALDELDSARGMMMAIAQTLKGQGADGVPPLLDKSWEAYGPLGALQKCLASVGRYDIAYESAAQALSHSTHITSQAAGASV